MRADARANRSAVIDAARTLIAERGVDVPLDAVAKRASVGIATLYRRFPTREDLIAAVVTDVQDRMLAAVHEHFPLPAEDPEPAWERFVRAVVAVRPGALVPVLAGSEFARSERAIELRQQMLVPLTFAIDEAKRAGLVHESVSVTSFQIGMVKLTRPLSDVPGDVDEVVDWLVGVYLAGLKALA